MSSDTDYKRLWRNEHAGLIKISNLLQAEKEKNKALVKVMQKIKDGKIDIKKIFEDEDMPEDIKTEEFIRQTAKKYREEGENKNG